MCAEAVPWRCHRSLIADVLVVLDKVTHPYKKDAVGNFLAHTKGVAALENKIQVMALSVFDEDLRIRIARATYDDLYIASYAETANPSIHIIVSEGNVTLVGAVKSDLDRSRAEEDARLVDRFLQMENSFSVEGQGTIQEQRVGRGGGEPVR